MKPTILILEITRHETSPPIWRIVEVKQNSTLHELHAVIQVAMGWKNAHLYSYTRSKEAHHIEFLLPEYDTEGELGVGNSPMDFKLKDIFREVGDAIFYTYDFGDNWVHEVKLKGVKYESSPFGYPACVAGARCCPPEDVGGVHGFAEMLKVFESKNKKAIKEIDDWLGYRYDPAEFSTEKFMLGLGKAYKRIVNGFSNY